MVQAMTTAWIPHRAEALVQVLQCGRLQWAGPSHGGLVLGDPGRKPGLAEQFASSRVQWTDKELLWATVFDIEVPRCPGEAGGGADGGETAGLVAGATEARFVDKALDHQDRLAVMVKPVVTETLEHQGQDAGSQVGKLLAVWEHKETGVVDDQSQASGPLAG